MDSVKNPFSPGAGTRPPDLVGRDDLLQDFAVLVKRVRLGKSEKSMILTGLRGVGKTVLLNEFERLAEVLDFDTIFIEAHEDKALAPLLAAHLRDVLYKMDRMSGISESVKRALRALRSFVGVIKLSYGDVSIGLDVEPERGVADSGDIEVDLPGIFLAVGDAVKDRNRLLVLFIDELQYFNMKELGALIMAMHRIQQKQLPIVFVGAGLPILPRLAGDSKSCAERLFNFPAIGPLLKNDAYKAIRDPIKASGVEIKSDALEEIYTLTKGYPYFLQEWGYQTWKAADHSPITLNDVRIATIRVTPRLDENFFRVRYNRLTSRQKAFLRAMAELGTGPFKTSDVAQVLNVNISSVSPVRAQLIGNGMIYSPEYGVVDFTVPMFGDFMMRQIPAL